MFYFENSGLPNRLVWEDPEVQPPPFVSAEQPASISSPPPAVPAAPTYPDWPAPVEKPPEEPKPINPGPQVPGKTKLEEAFPDLKPLAQALDKIKVDVFKGAKVDPQTANAMIDFTSKMRDATIHQAIVENWTEESLKDVFQKKMVRLRSYCESPFMEEYIIGLFRFQLSPDVIQPGENPNLDKRRLLVGRTWESAWSDVKDKLEKINARLYGDLSAKDKEKPGVKFVAEKLVPFYMEYFFNKAVVWDEDIGWIERNFTNFMEKRYGDVGSKWYEFDLPWYVKWAIPDLLLEK